MKLTINETGKVLTETHCDITLPADFSFAVVNDFVNQHETSFEQLQSLCLAMAECIEKIEHDIIPLLDNILMPLLDKGAYFAKQDEMWWLFSADGDGISFGKTISKLLINLTLMGEYDE